MMKVLALALVACTTAQELTASNVERRQVTESTGIFDMSTAVAAIDAEVSVINGQLNAGTVITFLSDLSADSIQATTSLGVENSALRSRVSTLQGAISSQAATLTDRLSQQTQVMNGALRSQSVVMSTMQTAIAGELSEAQADISTTVARSARSTAVTLSTLTRSTASQMAAMTTTTAASIGTINSTAIAALASKKPAKHHHWKGGCSSHKYGGWHYICHDRAIVNAAAPYFRTDGGSRWYAIVAGIYRVNAFTINSSCSWAHFGLIHNGGDVYTTHGHPSYWWYQDNYVNAEVKASVNHWWSFRSYASCGRLSYHNGYHGVLESHYEGSH